MVLKTNFYELLKTLSIENEIFEKFIILLSYNVNKPIEVLLMIWYEMTLADKKSTKMNFL